MEAAIRPRVKICCIGSEAEAWLAVRYGASALGLVSVMPSGPGVIEEELIRRIAATVPPGVGSFLLTSSQDPGAIIAQQRRCRTNTVQLVDEMRGVDYSLLRQALPGIGLVQVIHVRDESSVQEAETVAPWVDAVLLDSGNPTLDVKELGGTGRRHDWNLSCRIRELINKPVYLAGGLTPANVREAVETVGPFGLDICSGVRSNGQLDEDKLALFFEALD